MAEEDVAASGRIVLSRDDKNSDALLPEPGQTVEGDFYARVLLQDLPRKVIETPDPDDPDAEPVITYGDPIKITKATFLLDGQPVETVKDPKPPKWMKKEQEEALSEGRSSGVIEFAPKITLVGSHQLAVRVEFANGEVSETVAQVTPPPESTEPHPAVTLAQNLGASAATLDVIDKLMHGKKADGPGTKAALADIKKLSAKANLSLLETRTLAGLDTELRTVNPTITP